MDKLGDKMINPRDIEKLIEQGLEEAPGEDIEININKLNTDELMDKANSKAQHTLHELPSNYTPPSVHEESKPLVIDKKVIYIVAGVFALILITAITIKLISGRHATTGNTCDMQLVAGRNVKRNLEGSDWVTLSLPCDIAVGDLIKTGSDRRNVVSLPDGSSIRMDYNTTLKFNKASSQGDSYNLLVTLHKGEVFIDEAGSTNITVETKFAKFTPIGTRYCVTQIERKDLTEQSVVSVIEGSVSMNHLEDPNTKVVVTAGRQAGATAQSLVKPRGADKDSWADWNASWRDVKTMPALSAKAKSESRSDEANSHEPFAPQQPNGNNGFNGGQNAAEQLRNSQMNQNPAPMPQVQHQQPPAQVQDNRAEEEARLRMEAERLEQDRKRQEEQERKQREMDDRLRREADERNRVEEERRREEAEAKRIQAEQKMLQRQKKDLSSDKDKKSGSVVLGNETVNILEDTMPSLQTGNVVDFKSHTEATRQNRPQSQPARNFDPVNPNGLYYPPNPGAPSGRGGSLMMPTGDSSSMNATIGNQSDMNATIGNQSDMNATIGNGL